MPIRITGLNSGLDTESIISALVSSYNYKTDKYKKAQTKLSWKQDAWKELNTKIYSLYNSVGNLRFSSGYAMKTASVSDNTKAKVSVASGAVNGTQTLEVRAIAKSGYLTGGEIKVSDAKNAVKDSTRLSELGYSGAETEFSVTDKVDGKTTKIKISSGTTINDFVKQLNDAGVKASYDSKNQRIFISSAATGVKNDFTLKSTSEDGDKALKALGIYTQDTGFKTDKRDEFNKDSSKVVASDAEIMLNDVKFTSDTNEFSINGVSITATAVTAPGEKLSINVTTDADAIYDTVKTFLTQYNTLMNEMCALYNADSARGYEPLTDEERESMSDTEAEKWDEKIKASLLRRDDTLDGIISAMQTAMAKGYTIGDKSYNLSTFGIKTLGSLNAPKNEHNAYHIDGDKDDTATSGKEDMLLAAIKEDPDKVLSFMQELSKGLYDAVDKKMKATSLSSVYTVYNDKEMASEYSDYTSLIKKWEEKLAKQEEYYYNKFAAMETALSKLNSQTSSLAGLLGG